MRPTTFPAITAILAAHAFAQCERLTQTQGPFGGNSIAATIEGPTAYTWTPAGLARSENAGESWTLAPTGLPAGVIPTSLQLIEGALLAVSGLDLYRSTDGGTTWTRTSDIFATGRGILNFSRAGDSGLLALGEAFELAYSIDQGRTWTIIDNPGLSAITSDGTRIYGTSPSGVLTSDNFGVTWTQDATPPDNFFFGHEVAVIGSNVLAIAGWAEFRLFHSTDHGQNWDEVPDAPVGLSRLIDADDGSVLALGAAGVFRSLDAGLTWTLAATLPSHVFALSNPTFQSSQGVVLQSNYNNSGLLRSVNAGRAWSTEMPGLIATAISGLVWNGSSLHAFTSDPSALSSQIFSTSDRGSTWTPAWSTLSGYNPTASLRNNNSILLGTDGSGLLLSDNLGLTWSQITAGIPEYNSTAGPRVREISGLAVSNSAIIAATGVDWENVPPTPPNHSFATRTGGAGFLRSTNGGRSWTAMNDGFPVDWFNEFGQRRYNPVSDLLSTPSNVLAATHSRGLFAASHNSTTWTPANTGIPTCSGTLPYIAALASLGTDTFVALAGFPASCSTTGTGVYRSTNHGSSWSNASAGLPAGAAVTAITSHAGNLYAIVQPTATTPQAIYRSTDHGATWTRIDSTGNYTVHSLLSTPQGLFVATSGQGVLLLDPCIPCPADFDNSGGTPDATDIDAFFSAWLAGSPTADLNASGGTPDAADITAFFAAWLAGAC